MEQYGSYEVIKELSATQGVVVYLARTKGDGNAAAEAFVVKASSSADVIVDGTQLWRRGEAKSVPLKQPTYADPKAFLDAVTRQQRAGSQGSRYIAPVLECGQDERGAWYATRFYAHSIKNIIEGRVRLTSDVFFHAIRSITRGLLVFKKISGQSHGNLKPGNVLIGGEKKIRQAEIVLIDPSPDKADEVRACEVSDLHALGEIMYQLVRRKEVEVMAHWPLVASPEWSNLFGETADAWRELCNKLLDPQLSGQPSTLEELEVELAKLEPKPPVSTPVLVAIVAGLLLLSVVSFFLVWHWVGGKYGSIEITSAPRGAEVLLDGQKIGLTPYRANKLSPGEVNYLLRLNDHHEYPVKTNIVAGMKRKLHIVLSHETGTVILTSDPTGAEILKNGVVIGAAPYTNTFLTGKYTFTLRYPNLKQKDLPVSVDNNQTAVKRVEFPKVEIQAISNPSEATLVINGKLVGKTPTNLVFDPGLVSFELQKPGYNSATVKTNVVAKGPTAILVTLTRGQGTIELLSTPLGAEVYWNGQRKGSTPTNLTLPFGRQELVLKYGLLTDQTSTVEVGNDQRLNVDFPHATLIVQSQPSDAEVLFGTNVVRTPTNLLLNPGNIELSLRLKELSGTWKTNLANRTTNTALIPLAVGRGWFHVKSNPSGASILLEGRLLGLAESNIELPTGRHVLKARHLVYTNLEERSFNVDIEKDATKTNEVKFPYGHLVIDSQPTNAAIFHDGTRIGTTPHTNLFLKPGRVDYELRLEDYLTESVVTNIVDGQTVSVKTELSRGTGSIAFMSEPPGAQILINDYPVGITPLTNTLLTGTNLVKARYKDEPEQTTTVVLRLGEEKELRFRFELSTPELMTNGIGMILVKLTNDFWVGKFKVTVSEFDQILPGPRAKDGNRQAAKQTWTEAVVFCSFLTDSEQKAGRLSIKNDLAYYLPETNEWKRILQGKGVARVLVAEAFRPNPSSDALEWCFANDRDLGRPAPTIAVSRGATNELRTGALKLHDRDDERFTFRCVLVPRISRPKK